MTKMQALKASIEHWQDNVEKTIKHQKINTSIDSCKLCDTYYNHYDGCTGCPIKFYSGRDYCIETPYIEISAMVNETSFLMDKHTWEQLIAACWVEYLFLLNIWYANGGKRI